MGSEYDKVAKAIATNVPRRKLLKLMAGGVAAAVGSTIAGGAAAAKGRTFYIPTFTWVCEPVVNTDPNINVTNPLTNTQTSNTDEDCELVVNYVPVTSWWTDVFGGGIRMNGSHSHRLD